MTNTTPPACWTWPVPDPDARDPKLPPVGEGNHCISERTAAALRAAYDDPEVRAEALLERGKTAGAPSADGDHAPGQRPRPRHRAGRPALP